MAGLTFTRVTLLKLELLLSKKFQASIYHCEIIKAPAFLRDFLQCLIYTEGRSVWSVRSHGLNHISHTQDSCLQENVLTRQAGRVSRTIHSFMMLEHNLGYRPGKLYRFQYTVTSFGVGLNQFENLFDFKLQLMFHPKYYLLSRLMSSIWTIDTLFSKLHLKKSVLLRYKYKSI